MQVVEHANAVGILKGIEDAMSFDPDWNKPSTRVYGDALMWSVSVCILFPWYSGSLGRHVSTVVSVYSERNGKKSFSTDWL